jgi:uncharacterized protein (DUF58 family)
VIRTPTARRRGHAALAAGLLLAAVLLRRPEPVALAAPFAAVAVLGLARTGAVTVRVSHELGAPRLVEGEEVRLGVTVEACGPVAQVEVDVASRSGLRVEGRARAVLPPAGGVASFRLRGERWGGYAVPVTVRARDAFGMAVWEGQATPAVVRVYPAATRLRVAPRPARTQASVGADRSRAAGEGLEFADLRPYQPGDRLRRVNWRVSARRGSLHTNVHHPERNADVVLFLDAFAESPVTVDMAVRAGVALALTYLRGRDRVGVVGFGGVLRWVVPSSGRLQVYRVLDSLIDTQVVASYAWRDVEVIPTRTLPPGALVLALSPLADDRSLAALAALRSRGFDLAVVDVSPVAATPPGPASLGPLAHRLWVLRREAVRRRLAASGVPVVEWAGGPLDAALAGLQEARRSARIAPR